MVEDLLDINWCVVSYKPCILFNMEILPMSEKSLRTRLAMAAYAYEFKDHSIMTDEEFDRLSRLVDVSVETDRPEIDKFFKEEFNPSTGMWIWKHPDLENIAKKYSEIFSE